MAGVGAAHWGTPRAVGVHSMHRGPVHCGAQSGVRTMYVSVLSVDTSAHPTMIPESVLSPRRGERTAAVMSLMLASLHKLNVASMYMMVSEKSINACRITAVYSVHST